MSVLAHQTWLPTLTKAPVVDYTTTQLSCTLIHKVKFQHNMTGGTFAASDDRDASWLAPHTEDDWPLHPGNEEVGPLPHHVGEDPAKSVK